MTKQTDDFKRVQRAAKAKLGMTIANKRAYVVTLEGKQTIYTSWQEVLKAVQIETRKRLAERG